MVIASVEFVTMTEREHQQAIAALAELIMPLLQDNEEAEGAA